MNSCVALVLAAGFAFAGLQVDSRWPERRNVRLPNGKPQIEEVLKAEHEKSMAEAKELVKLAEELQAELEKNDRHVLSISALKKTEEIEKLAKRIRSRMRR